MKNPWVKKLGKSFDNRSYRYHWVSRGVTRGKTPGHLAILKYAIGIDMDCTARFPWVIIDSRMLSLNQQTTRSQVRLAPFTLTYLPGCQQPSASTKTDSFGLEVLYTLLQMICICLKAKNNTVTNRKLHQYTLRSLWNQELPRKYFSQDNELYGWKEHWLTT